MQKIIISILLIFFMSQAVEAQSPGPYNVSNTGVAIGGYDPVAYFQQGKAIEGKKTLMVTVGDAIYYFSTSQHAALFKADPSRYQPQYGGWCAYAMGVSGEKVEIDPETFKIIDGKLYLFYNKLFNNTLKSWNKDEVSLKNKADANWQKIHH